MANPWDIVAEQADAGQPAAGEWDVVQIQREVPFTEALPRGLKGAGMRALEYGNLVPSAGAVIADKIAGVFGHEPGLADAYFATFMRPYAREAEEAALQPDETPSGTAAGVAIEALPEVGKFLPDLAYGGGAGAALPKAAPRVVQPVLDAVVDTLRRGTVVGLPAGERAAVEREMALRGEGVDPIEAGVQGAATGLMTTGQFALPASAGSAAKTLAGRVASRGAQGAGLNVAAGATQRQAENLILPDEAEGLRQDPLDPNAVALEAMLGPLFGQMGGRRASAAPDARAQRRAAGYDNLLTPEVMAEQRLALSAPDAVPALPGPREPAALPPPAHTGRVVVDDAGAARTEYAGEEPSRVARRIDEARRAPVERPQIEDRSRVIEGEFRRVEEGLPAPEDEVPGMFVQDGEAMRPATYADLEAGRTGREVGRYQREDLGNTSPQAVVRRAARGEADGRPAATPDAPALARGGDPGAPPPAGGGRPQGAEPAPRPEAPAADSRGREGVATELREMAQSAGWAEVGGRLVRNKRSDVQGDEEISRTKWIPKAEWFQRMRSGLGRKGLSTRDEITGAVERWLNREPLNARQQNTIDHMLEEVEHLRSEWQFVPEETRGDYDPFTVDASLRDTGVEPNAQSLHDTALVQRAAEMDEAAVERLAIQHGDDTESFLRAIREVVDGNAKADDATAARESGETEQAAPRDDRWQGEERPGFELERPTEEGLRAREAERAAGVDEARETRRMADVQREAFALSSADQGTAPPRDVSENQTPTQQEGLFSATGEPKGGTTLYAGPPLGEMLKFAAETVERAVGPMGEWRQAGLKMKAAAEAVAKAFARGARKVGKDAPAEGESMAGNIGRMLFYNVHSHIKSFGEAWKSPTVRRIADMIYSTAGERQAGQSFHEATAAHMAERQKTLSEIAADAEALLKVGVSDQHIIRMVENPKARQGKAGEIAARIAKWLAEEHVYMREAGVDVGEHKNYYPREYDRAKIIPRRSAFEADAARAYEKMGLSADEAKNAASAFWFRKAYGSDGSPAFEPRGGREAMTKTRELTPEAAEELRAWRTESIGDTMNAYLMRSTRRAEIARRFGDGWKGWDDLEKQIIKEASGIDHDQLKELRGMVASAMGLRTPTLGVAAHTGAQYLRLWTTLATMPKAAMSSIAETWIPLVRANGDLAVSVNHLRNVLYENTRSMLKQALGAGRTEKMQEMFDFAEDLGALSQSPLSNLMADRWMGGEVDSKRVSAITSKFFRLNMLEQVTNWQRAISVDAGRIFLRRQALRATEGKKAAAFYLEELGVPAAKVKDFAAYVKRMGDDIPEPHLLTGEMGQAYRRALVRFADQTIQRPGAATRPSWANTDWGAVVFQLQGFANAFHKNVLLRQANLLKEGATGDYTGLERIAMMGGMIPGLMMSAATAGLVWEARDHIYNREPRKRTTQARVERAISGAGLVGALDPYLNMVGGIRYHRSPAAQAGGPSFGAIDTAVTTLGEYWLANSDRTNNAERRAMDAFYQWGVEPAATLLLAATPAPVSPATQALTVLAIPASKQAFVEATAGSRKKRKQPPIKGIFEPK